MTTWDLNLSDFEPVTVFTKNVVLARFGESVSIEHAGFTFDNPGIVFEISGLDSFNDNDIKYLKSSLLNYGANQVDIGYDTETCIISMDVYILKNHSDNLENKNTPKNSLCCKTINTTWTTRYRFILIGLYTIYRILL